MIRCGVIHSVSSFQTYQSITVADGHRGLRHVAHIPGENTVPMDPLLGLFHKVLLPFHKGPGGHQPPVGPQAEVQFFPKHGDIEKQVLSRGRGDRGHLGGIAGHPPPAAAGTRGGSRTGSVGERSSSSSGIGIGSSTFASTSRGDHVRNVPAVGVCAEWHDKTIFT